MLPRVPSPEPAATSSNRKGSRRVCTLTPSQLARKRANDREAQRVIRARTKEHIQRLEREIEELCKHESRKRTVQDLLRRNRALEEELRQLKDGIGPASMISSPYSGPTSTAALGTLVDADPQQHWQSYSLVPPTPSNPLSDDSLSASSGGVTVPSPQMSPMPPTTDYAPLPMFGQEQQQNYEQPPQPPQPHHCGGIPNSSRTWDASTSGTTVDVSSSIPNPSPSVLNGHGDAAADIPMGLPITMMPSREDAKLNFGGVPSMGQGCPY
ncbi:hypothetical protein PLICBS_004154 [Purpureocillium lilacinum]|uniref:uncharacterized protein n=1 Tax=Purpureocillium lilacinum TaxID=33203 RepID=UPI00208B2871|nr:hypothetical protein PLICBS_004154 [Purpureocillium lilacinum]